MRTLSMTSAACCLAAALGTVSHSVQAEDAIPPKPAAHTERQIEGWTVHVDDRLLNGEAALGQKALRLLETRLVEVKLVVPAEKVERLQKVTFWLDQTCGALKSPQYHPDVEWLKKHEYDAQLAKCVHIPSADYFCAPRFQREQPLGVLHELAHAYHDQVLSFEHAEIKAAWRKFAEGGRYGSVLHAGGKRRPHYALVNQMEFFAEMTESYFGSNDFFPFNAAELQQEEPEIHALLTTIWGPLPM
ncbi:MAG: metallopeptidase [Pirellulaceae bacterium]